MYLLYLPIELHKLIFSKQHERVLMGITCKHYYDTFDPINIINNTKTSELCDEFASDGNLEMLKIMKKYKCDICQYTTTCAAKSGNLDVLEWLLMNNCWYHTGISIMAAKFGHTNVLNWCKKNKYKISECIGIEATIVGRLNTFIWSYDHGWSWCIRPQIIFNMIKYERLNIIQWMIYNKFSSELVYTMTNIAAELGKTNVIEWFIKNKFHISRIRLSFEAVKGGHLDVLKLLKQHNLLDIDTVYAFEAKTNDIIEWLNEINTQKN
jgi:hypothetical protein